MRKVKSEYHSALIVVYITETKLQLNHAGWNIFDGKADLCFFKAVMCKGAIIPSHFRELMWIICSNSGILRFLGRRVLKLRTKAVSDIRCSNATGTNGTVNMGIVVYRDIFRQGIVDGWAREKLDMLEAVGTEFLYAVQNSQPISVSLMRYTYIVQIHHFQPQSRSRPA